jgi:hypothetical protein
MNKSKDVPGEPAFPLQASDWESGPRREPRRQSRRRSSRGRPNEHALPKKITQHSIK